jgi:hypothetical protein
VFDAKIKCLEKKIKNSDDELISLRTIAIDLSREKKIID